MWPSRDKSPTKEFNPNTALRRLIYFVLLGCSFILAYTLPNGRGTLFSILSVGLMAAGAALAAGGLLGFLFGVPYTREQGQGDTVPRTSPAVNKPSVTAEPSTTYPPNTSLEQISDWLTKMLVGVGLVEIKTIAGKVLGLANFVAMGLGDTAQAKVFALSLLAYFGLGGFVFGFLWARLYLPKWFREADRVDRLEKEVSKLQADANALALATYQIKRTQDDPAGSDRELADAIQAASSGARDLIFELADQVYEKRKTEKSSADQTWVEGVISVFNALIATDVGERNHEYHSKLSQALRRAGDLKGAISEVSKAIVIRNKLNKKGWWKWYEFNRARCLIENDSNFIANKPSDETTVSQIRSDIQEAFGDKNWIDWYGGHKNVREWMKLNLGIEDGKHEP